MRVLFYINVREQSGHTYFTPFCKLLEGVVDGSKPFRGEIIADVVDDLLVVNSALVGELLLEGANLLRGQEHSTIVQEEVEIMLGHTTLTIGIKGWDVSVEMDEVFMIASEQLEFDLVADLDNWVHPVH